MSRYALSDAPDADLLRIITDSVERWGMVRADQQKA